MTKVRQLIKVFHKELDAFIGKYILRTPDIENYSKQNMLQINEDNFTKFTYSKLSHFRQFKIMPYHKTQTTSTCDLKVYQDLLIYSFILENLPKGAKILEIGGGESRVISELKDEYEFWNLDRIEGKGHGPIKISEPQGYSLVRDYIGSFSDQLPNNYFDLIYSISTFEHLPTGKQELENVIVDIQRLLSKNAYSSHCVDALLFKNNLWVHPIVSLIKSKFNGVICETNFNVINFDEDLWKIPPYAYYTRWFPITKKLLKSFGHPLSLNIYWKN